MIRIDPPDHPDVQISVLKPMEHGWVTGSSIAMDHWPGPPILICPLAGQVVMPHNDRHPWMHIQEDQLF